MRARRGASPGRDRRRRRGGAGSVSSPDRITRAAGRESAADRRRQRHQRPGEDVGDDQVVGRVGADRAARRSPSARPSCTRARDAVQPHILPRHRDRDRIDVAGQTAALARLAMAMASTPDAGAEVERVPDRPRAWRAGRWRSGTRPSCRGGRCRRPAPASISMAMSFGADAAAVVAAVDEEAAGAHRRQPGEALRHPVGFGQRLRS